MKTQYELRYEKLVISMVTSHNMPKDQKISALYEFHQNSRCYYESFCDALYLLASGRSDYSLYLTPAGEPKLLESEPDFDCFLIMEPSDIPFFHDDLLEQIEYAFSRMEKMIWKKL